MIGPETFKKTMFTFTTSAFCMLLGGILAVKIFSIVNAQTVDQVVNFLDGALLGLFFGLLLGYLLARRFTEEQLKKGIITTFSGIILEFLYIILSNQFGLW